MAFEPKQEHYYLDADGGLQKTGVKRRLQYTILTLIVAALASLLWYLMIAYVPVHHNDTATEVEIPSGYGSASIAAELKEMGLIRSKNGFVLHARITGASNALKAGTYIIPPESTTDSIIQLLSEGSITGDTVQVTLVEGWREDQILLALQEAGLQITQEAWVNAISTEPAVEYADTIFDGKPAGNGLEGYLYPETYEFYSDATADEIVLRLVEQFVEEVQPLLADAPTGLSEGLSFYEMLTIASVVERELLLPDERANGASIFVQRYLDGYPLESDATVNYVTGKKTTRPTAADLQIESAYNTYKNIGLPPTPISNPSITSIQAVWEAQETPYYFFLTTPEGDAIFSKTFEEHLVNKRKYYPN